jgi:RNA polymerase sigma factor (sigma-70 family)
MFTKKRRDSEVCELAARLYREKRSHLLRIARCNTGSAAVAEEALQEAFISFLRSFDPGSGAPPLAWLTTTLKRECWARQRGERLDRRVGREAAGGDGELGSVLESIPTPGHSLEERVADRDQARRQLAGLKPDERTSLGLLAAGFSYKEIAARRGWTRTKVNRCVSEGRAALREPVAA